MNKRTKQMEAWQGDFGRDYTDRNALSLAEMEEYYRQNFSLTRTEMNQQFVGDLDRAMRILEVGSNVGNQLLCLQQMGFKNLFGIEIQEYAVEFSKQRTRNVNIIQGSAFDIPFKDGYFDLVFTSGVLIHISPSDIGEALKEIHRCSRRYIWGYEYYADEYEAVRYRGESELLWKTNFPKLYLDIFPDLRLLKEAKYKYLSNPNVDVMFLLEKSQ